MSKIVIKKHVSLAFLGEEYKDAELVFRSIPLSEYDKLMDDLPTTNPEITELSEKVELGGADAEDKKRLAELMKESGLDNKKSLGIILKYLKEYFVSGKFPNDEGKLEDLSAEDIDGLDQRSAMKCFEALTGETSDPKVSPTSEMPSSTEPVPQ